MTYKDDILEKIKNGANYLEIKKELSNQKNQSQQIITQENINLDTELQYLKDNFKKINSFLRSTMNISGKENKTVKITSKMDNTMSYYNSRYNIITLGMKYAEYSNISIIHKTIMHEFLHAIGLKHCSHMRLRGYYSFGQKDTFSKEVMREIGWELPTRKQYSQFSLKVREEIREEREDYIEDSKYVIYCECGYKTYRKTESKVVKQANKYLCPKCKKRLFSEKI